MKYRLSALALLLALASVLLVPFSVSAAPSPAVSTAVTNQLTNIPVTGTFPGGTFAGEFDITRFAVRNGQLGAVGTLTGTLTDTLGNVIGTVNQQVFIPITNIDGTCEILDLTLGPIDLDLLGLRVQVSQIDILITAVQGQGNLLGNLLCAIAGLLDNTPNVNGVARLLNRLLRILG